MPQVAALLVFDAGGGELARSDGGGEVRLETDCLLGRGAGVALHGRTLLDDAAARRRPADWLRRRVLTAGEGEFAAMQSADARIRIDSGRELLARLGWRVSGFVPPAWLASAGTREALRHSGLSYTTTHGALVHLPAGARMMAPCLTASTRSAWRRLASRGWIGALRSLGARLPLLRVGLHPADARDPRTMATWERVLAQLLAARAPRAGRATALRPPNPLGRPASWSRWPPQLTVQEPASGRTSISHGPVSSR